MTSDSGFCIRDSADEARASFDFAGLPDLVVMGTVLGSALRRFAVPLGFATVVLSRLFLLSEDLPVVMPLLMRAPQDREPLDFDLNSPIAPAAEPLCSRSACFVNSSRASLSQ